MEGLFSQGVGVGRILEMEYHLENYIGTEDW
jgi:hypothetical protein